jgi:hypothetical protein
MRRRARKLGGGDHLSSVKGVGKTDELWGSNRRRVM